MSESAKRNRKTALATQSAATLHKLPTIPVAMRSGSPLWRDVVCRKRLSQLRLERSVATVAESVVAEWRAQSQLLPYGWDARRKILLAGPPGWGKTSLAAAVAAELELPCVAISAAGVLSSYLGESGKNLDAVLDGLGPVQAVVIWDEFDSLAAARAGSNDVGEMRRVCNDLLGVLDRMPAGVLAFAATNLWGCLDAAVWRRFDVVLPIGPTADSDRDIMPDWAAAAIAGVVQDVIGQAAAIAAGGTRERIVAAGELLAVRSVCRSPAAAERVARDAVRGVLLGHAADRAVEEALDTFYVRRRIEGSA